MSRAAESLGQARERRREGGTKCDVSWWSSGSFPVVGCRRKNRVVFGFGFLFGLVCLCFERFNNAYQEGHVRVSRSSLFPTNPEIWIASALQPLTTEDIRNRQMRAMLSWARLGMRAHVLVITESEMDFQNMMEVIESTDDVSPSMYEMIRVRSEEFPLADGENNRTVRLPMINHILEELGKRARRSEIPMMYVNSDIVLFPALATVIRLVSKIAGYEKYVISGSRTEVKLNSSLVNADPTAEIATDTYEKLLKTKNAGSWNTDYFVFGRDTWQSVPDFVIGRPRFDNWLIANARGFKVRTLVPCMHVTHGYEHVGFSSENGESGKSSPVIYQQNPGKDYNERLGIESEARGDIPW
eukprot:CAMPEP_0184684514 /NCGR_PEP_ID=MMETSP0312-20130426/15587_1 /TAXON_ID=31354 /ORGANISM="Compsopogon coeruleus, Strain SAG 36.94" /LENGTH=355 /DNA_ID=CAMNT_0027137753 /DNA_START=109 /DNA_END=1173 /DNA_ORIENTATION=-